MATQPQQQPVHGGTPVDDFDAIAATVQLYIDGSAEGDAAKLSEGFHASAQMYGAVGEDRYDEPITEYIKLMAESPGGDTLRGRITSITQVGDAATATVIEDGFWGRCPSSPSSRSLASMAAGAWSTRPSRTPAARCQRKPRTEPTGRARQRQPVRGPEQRTRTAQLHIAGLLLALQGEPQHQLAFRRGQHGEVAVAESLRRRTADSVVLLHDRRMPGGRGNIDHLVIVPTGVYVVDAETTRARFHLSRPAAATRSPPGAGCLGAAHAGAAASLRPSRRPGA